MNEEASNVLSGVRLGRHYLKTMLAKKTGRVLSQKTLFAEVKDKAGKLDVLFTNAGTAR